MKTSTAELSRYESVIAERGHIIHADNKAKGQSVTGFSRYRYIIATFALGAICMMGLAGV